MTIRIILIVLSISLISYAQTQIHISDIKNNDSNGVPTDTGQVFTISGIVTSSNQFGNSGPGSVQDNTGAISIYGNGFSNQVNIGDSVVVTALLDQYNGLTELNFGSTSTLNIISPNKMVNPQVVTVSQINNQQWNGFEEYESKLVRINNVTISGSGNFSGGTSGQNYDISDTTGTMQIRIDESTDIVGTPIPSGEVDIVGIVGQYKYSPPYDGGYQLFPRFRTDIIDNGLPIILTPVFASNITTSSFTVYFKTSRKGNTEIKYGLTPNLELDSLIINDDATQHAIQVTELTSATTYYYKVYSENTKGQSESELYNTSTASANPAVGEMDVYFNFPVDTSIALPGNAAKGNVNFEQKLIDRINHANYSIDMAVYSFFGMKDVADALVVAKNRKVKIRVVYENRNIQDSMQELLDNGIQMSQRPSNLDGIMHDKFFIFDARDTIQTDDWLWTGSWNVTSTELGWKNNVIEINDPTITKAYQTEFEEMWGSDTDTPNSVNAKFGIEKTDSTTHSFSIKGIPVYVYFSPSDGTTSKIINAINSANHDIFFAQYTFTRNDISQAINNMYNSDATDVRGVINQINDNGSEYTYLSGFADMHANSGATLHDKYGIIDAEISNSDPIVITGSHNWSTAAETVNDENTLIIHDALIANQYLQDFKKRYNDAGGTGTFMIPTGINDHFKINKFSYKLYQNFPNPFNPVTTIRFEVPNTEKVQLSIYDILGRKVKTLFDKVTPAGIVAVDFNGSDLASGVYIYRIEAGGYTASKKLVLMK